MIKHTERFAGVNSRLVATCYDAAQVLPFDVMLIEGLRSAARQAELWAQGRTTPGKQVTWTKHSKHQDGEAVDLAPINVDGSIDWANFDKFASIHAALVTAAKSHGIGIRWGADWDGNGVPRERGETDSPHFEVSL